MEAIVHITYLLMVSSIWMEASCSAIADNLSGGAGGGDCTHSLSMEQRISQLEQMVLAQQLALKSLGAQAGHHVIAFTATMSTSNGADITVTANKRLPYNLVISNQGDGFNPSTATFSCPSAGLYAFTVNVMNGNSAADCNVKLLKDGVEIGRARPHSAAHSMGSNFFIIQCQKNDALWAEIDGKSSCVFHTYYHYNTFSGFRLS